MKKVSVLALCFVLILSLVSCGSSDALKGTWTGENQDIGAVTWTFDGGGKCTYKNEYSGGKGTYTITENKVTIELDSWDDEKVYDFSATDNSLKLTATDGLSPDYDLAKK